MNILALESDEIRTEAKSYRIQNNGSVIDVYQYFDYGVSKYQYVVEIESPIFEKDNYHLMLSHRNLKLIVSEVKEVRRPIYAHHYAKDIFEKRSYECLRTFTIVLPHNSSLFIEQSLYDPERKQIRVILKQHLN